MNSSEIREIDYLTVVDGIPTPWKIAMWGSAVDAKLLEQVQHRFPSLGQLEDDEFLVVSQGPEFIDEQTATEETAERHEELIGERTVLPEKVKGRRFLHRFPDSALKPLGPADVFVRRRGGVTKPLIVCHPPHVIVGASRNFAIYEKQFLVVPPRHIGITSVTNDEGFLKALALYLNSDFVAYQQFFSTTQAGIQKSIGTLEALRSLPLPFQAGEAIGPWISLYDRILREVPDQDDFVLPELVRQLNELTFDSLRLSKRARAAVHDLVHVRFGLTRGKTATIAIGRPGLQELTAYAKNLVDDLDSFIGATSDARHHADILVGGGQGLIEVRLVAGDHRAEPVRILNASDEDALRLAKTRARLTQRSSQWLYFNRNLLVYDGTETYILKPLQHLHWTRTQAIQDAGEIIADSLRPVLQLAGEPIN